MKNTTSYSQPLTAKRTLGIKLFLSLSLQGAIDGMKMETKNDEIDEEMNAMLLNMIISASEVLVGEAIEA
jgi:hypothetical protein